MIEHNAFNKIKVSAEQSGFEALLDFFAFQNEHQNLDQYLEELDEFLAVSFHAQPLIVAATTDNESYRLIWNENVLGDEYPARDLLILNTFLLENYMADGDVCFEHDGYYIFLIGEDQRERYWGFFKINRKSLFGSKLYDYFVKLVQKSFCTFIQAGQHRSVNELIFRDDITGLFNHRRLRLDLETLVDEYYTQQQAFSVLFVDIDHFKNVNDGNGHLVGTELLRQLGNVIQQTVCEGHFVYRYGGDEFVVLLPKAGESEAKTVAERILQVVRGQRFIVKDINFSIGVSIGVSCFPKDASDSNEIIDVADKMMYHAKKNGRGKVSLTSELLG